MKVLIKNVKIITPNEILIGHDLLIKDDRIHQIDKSSNFKYLKSIKIIDGRGNYLSPGFIDIHNHGNSGYDVMDSTEEALDNMGMYHISNGVTSYLGTVITSSYESMIDAMGNMVSYNNKEDIANLLGIHLEGPFFNMIKKGAQPETHIKLPSIEDMKKIIDTCENKLKMVSLAPELNGAIDIIKLLKENNITIAMGHSNATYNEAKKGIEYGANVATHLYNGMRNFSHREPGIIGASLTDNRVFCEIIYDRVHLHDAAVKIAFNMKGSEKIILVSDAMRAAGLNEGVYDLGGQKVNVVDGEARLESGSLAGSTLNLQQAIFNMINYLNIPIYDVVNMASLSPARAIKLDDDIGSIEVGKRADLVLFDSKINIKKVILGGKISWKEN